MIDSKSNNGSAKEKHNVHKILKFLKSLENLNINLAKLYTLYPQSFLYESQQMTNLISNARIADRSVSCIAILS